jgi:hypothetical protein
MGNQVAVLGDDIGRSAADCSETDYADSNFL